MRPGWSSSRRSAYRALMYWESTSTPTLGCSARIRSAATRPSSECPGGMRMSTIATSGCSEPHVAHELVRHRSPCPRPSTPASRSSWVSPSRISIASSATTTRMAALRGRTTPPSSDACAVRRPSSALMRSASPTSSPSSSSTDGARSSRTSTVSTSPSRRAATLSGEPSPRRLGESQDLVDEHVPGGLDRARRALLGERPQVRRPPARDRQASPAPRRVLRR